MSFNKTSIFKASITDLASGLYNSFFYIISMKGYSLRERERVSTRGEIEDDPSAGGMVHNVRSIVEIMQVVATVKATISKHQVQTHLLYRTHMTHIETSYI